MIDPDDVMAFLAIVTVWAALLVLGGAVHWIWTWIRDRRQPL